MVRPDKMAAVPRILLTGATGYIGSHTWLALHDAGFHVVGVDDFSNSSPRRARAAGRAVGACAGVRAGRRVRRRRRWPRCSGAMRIDAVVHFAALQGGGRVGAETARVLRQQPGRPARRVRRRCKRTSVTHAGVQLAAPRCTASPQRLPITEDAPLSATNPYGTTKLMGEQLLRDLERCDPAWRIACLRYFNPVGAHASGRIGEDPRRRAQQPDALRRRRWRWARCNTCRCSATTTTRPTAPACATTST